MREQPTFDEVGEVDEEVAGNTADNEVEREDYGEDIRRSRRGEEHEDDAEDIQERHREEERRDLADILERRREEEEEPPPPRR